MDFATKRCRGCGEDKPLSAFYRDRARRDGRQSACIECQGSPERRAAKRAQMRRLREGHRTDRVAGGRIGRLGLSRAEFDALLIEYAGRCGGCGSPMLGDVRIDHDHATGDIRGLLCNGCNVALGMVADDPRRLAGLIAYLERS